MDKNLEAMWENCLFFMRDNLASSEEGSDMKKLEDSFALLFDKVRPLSFVDGNLTLGVPSNFYKEYIEEHYISLLSVTLKKYFGKGILLRNKRLCLLLSLGKGIIILRYQELKK